ncbi:MAG: nitrous oxide-stimulated promoter family protein [bacterium]|nr:nitrous oxide-stimulated promoter family protein [bacterium]
MNEKVKIVKLMIELFCKDNYLSKNNLCDDCHNRYEHVINRLENYQYKNRKQSCRKCVIQCFGQKEKEQIVLIMKYLV